jgi:hypothetical protein
MHGSAVLQMPRLSPCTTRAGSCSTSDCRIARRGCGQLGSLLRIVACASKTGRDIQPLNCEPPRSAAASINWPGGPRVPGRDLRCRRAPRRYPVLRDKGDRLTDLRQRARGNGLDNHSRSHAHVADARLASHNFGINFAGVPARPERSAVGLLGVCAHETNVAIE